MQTLLADLLVREWGGLVDEALTRGGRPAVRQRSSSGVVRTVARAARQPALRAASSRSTPSCCCPTCSSVAAGTRTTCWICCRRRSAPARRDRSVRAGDPDLLGRSLLLAVQGFVLSARPRWPTPAAGEPRRRARRCSSRGTSRHEARPAPDASASPPPDAAPTSHAPPRTPSTCSWSVSASPAPESRSTPPPAGCRVVAVDAHDLAFGTSRWSSKLVHGGLRYLANGQVGVAHESALERGVLMTRTAPHLTRPLPMVIPLTPACRRSKTALTLRGSAPATCSGPPPDAARPPPPPRGGSRRERTLALAPAVRRDGLRGGLLSYDGQLEDDARLVVALARTAAAHGARILTRARGARARPGTAPRSRTRSPARPPTVRARAVVNAAGVWAGGLVPDLDCGPAAAPTWSCADALAGTDVGRLRPRARRAEPLRLRAAPARRPRLRRPDRRAGRRPDARRARPPTSRRSTSCSARSAAPSTPARPGPTSSGTYAGLRPLLAAEGTTADLSRRHAVLTSDTGVVTVVGGKLTTYRQMAEDAVDAVVHCAAWRRPCRTANLPLVGAAPRRAARRSTRRPGWSAATAPRRRSSSRTRSRTGRRRSSCSLRSPTGSR